MDLFRPTLRGARRILSMSAFLAALCLVPGEPGSAIEIAAPEASSGSFVPSEFGDIVFQTPGHSDRQVFIIGHSHRSARTGANGSHTVRAQAEVYRLGEWLIQRENVRLLLPEGFFRRQPEVTPVPAAFGAEEVSKGQILDHQTLVERLSDTSVFVNADILLKSNYRIRLQQVESDEIYQSVNEFLRLMDQASGTIVIPGKQELELDYLQEIRSAAILQNIPEVIEKEFQQGTIAERKALFTIGMAHVDEIVRFLREGRIDIKAPQSAADRQDLQAILKLAEAGYGVTVILPRSLVEDQEALRLANLNQL